MNTIAKKGPFMGMVFTNLIFQCFVAYTTATNSDKAHVNKNLWLYLIAFIGSFMSLLVVDMSVTMKVLAFTIFSAVTGAILSRNDRSPKVIQEVAMIFVAMLILGLVSIQLKIDLRPYTPILIAALVALLTARLFNVPRVDLGEVGTVIFAMLVVFNTNNILQKDYDGDFVQASLDYFIDITNLLSYSENLSQD
jgi:FtsH-binding integral membrane protein